MLFRNLLANWTVQVKLTQGTAAQAMLNCWQFFAVHCVSSRWTSDVLRFLTVLATEPHGNWGWPSNNTYNFHKTRRS